MITREEALRLCEIVLAQAKAAGAEDASVSLNSSIESHARFADNRITTSGRAENLDITATVWVERRRGSAAGSDADGSALKRLADEAVQIARVSPVHREYVPTLGPLDYGEAGGFAAATADIDLVARASALEAALASCRTAKVTGAGFHIARASAAAAATANGNRRFFRSSEGSFSLTARSADGTGSGTSQEITSIWRAWTCSRSPGRRWARRFGRSSRRASNRASTRSFSSPRRCPI